MSAKDFVLSLIPRTYFDARKIVSPFVPPNMAAAQGELWAGAGRVRDNLALAAVRRVCSRGLDALLRVRHCRDGDCLRLYSLHSGMHVRAACLRRGSCYLASSHGGATVTHSLVRTLTHSRHSLCFLPRGCVGSARACDKRQADR